MTDHVAELADRTRAMSESRLAIEWGALTDAEQDEFMALLDQRTAHGQERLEALAEDNRVLRLLLAHREGAITALEFAERVRGAMPDPLAGQSD